MNCQICNIDGLPICSTPNNTSEDSKETVNRFQFLFENPFLLQDLLSREKVIPSDQLEIDWTLHPDRPVAQTVSLIRLQRSYIDSRFQVRITSDSRVLAMPTNLVSTYNSSNAVDLNDLSDSDAIPQVVEEFLTLSEDRFMLLLHYSESSWEMIACLSPLPFVKAEVIDLSSDEEEPVPPPLQQPTSSTIHQPVWTNPELTQHVFNIVDPIVPSYDAQQSVTAALSFEIPRFDLGFHNIDAMENQPLFQCSVCQRVMSSKNSLIKHRKTHDPKNAPKCPDPTCSYATHRKDHMNRHVEAHHPALIEGPIYTCPTCPKKFRWESSYEGHIKMCGGIKSFSCPSCDYITKRRGNLKKHQIEKHSLLRELLSDRSRSITPPTD